VGKGPPPASTREPLAELPPKSFQHNLEELTRRLEAGLGDRPRAAMIAYLFWHCAHPTTTVKQYEEALLRFQQHLGQQQPPGFRGSASFRVADLPWLGNQPGYEDWCLLDGSWALDPLNSFAVAGPVVSAHDAAATQMDEGVWRALRLSLGRTRFAEAVDGSLADAAAGHLAADDSRCAATFGNDIMAASDGAQTWQGVRSH